MVELIFEFFQGLEPIRSKRLEILEESGLLDVLLGVGRERAWNEGEPVHGEQEIKIE